MAQVLNEQFGLIFVLEPDGKDDELRKFKNRIHTQLKANDILKNLSREEIENKFIIIIIIIRPQKIGPCLLQNILPCLLGNDKMLFGIFL